MQNLILLRWIPLVPLAASACNIFFGSRLGRKGAAILASAAVGFSFLLSVWVSLLLPAGGVVRDSLFTWIESGPFNVPLAFQVDALTAVMLLVVTGVGFVIHLYSIGYMAHDEGIVRFFAYMNLFIFFMLVLVMADNLLLLFVGWEGVGLCSYLLIGFWYEEHTNAIAGNKAFVVNRMGDFCFLLGMILLFWEMAARGVWGLDFSALKENAHLLAPERVTLITLLLFVGATGKSAQIPLYVWLPDAMQGPTPVSALIHAATMVTAGVYMIARLSFLFALAPLTLTVVATVGVVTALVAATIALAQNDIKRVLAYSTVSQLGYMFLAAGVGAFSAAIFHLFTHAFFKACLFLTAGSVIHGLQGEQDMRKMGGLRKRMPVTFWTYLIAALAISGAPLTAGFFSKDEILWEAYAGPGGSSRLWLAAWITAGLTALYMFRQFFMVFCGESRAAENVRARIHESPRVMTVPLIVLALGSVFAGWVGTPEFLWGSAWQRWLGPMFSLAGRVAEEGGGREIYLMLLTLAIAALGFLLAYLSYQRGVKLPEHLSSCARGIPYRLLAQKYYVDEIYDFFLVRPFTAFSRWLAAFFDVAIIDGMVNGLAERVREGGLAGRRLQTGNVQHYLLGFLIGTLVILGYYLAR